jgi:large subunit ribosomal protein L29
VKAEKYRDLTDDELVQKLKDTKEELFNLRFQLATGQLSNPMKIKDAKRDIARIQTVRMEREIEAKIAAG